MMKIGHLNEPKLRFGHDQTMEDPRNGLFLFGPLINNRKPSSMRVGVIGTPRGLSQYREWVRRITAFVPAERPDVAHHVAFPGFEAVFRTQWPIEPVLEIAVSASDISKKLRLSDRHVSIFETVSLFEDPIRKRIRSDDVQVDLWFVIIPEEVYVFGRPLSRVSAAERIEVRTRLNARLAKRFRSQPSLFAEDMSAAEVYRYDLDFHHQLKARLLDVPAVVQVVRETSISDPVAGELPRARRLQDRATVAWNITTTSFFKAGGRPWKLADMRPGVCYVGIVFKKLDDDEQGESACCGAQLFLDSGDGLVFKGAIGDWYSRASKEFHVTRETARDLLKAVVEGYWTEFADYPRELFIHAKTRFSAQEWAGFVDAAPPGTKVIGVKINRSGEAKIYRPNATPVIRGTYLRVDDRRAYLWTSGYVPYLETYAGREVPNPLLVEVSHGEACIETVLSDVLSLTKVNFNACIYGDGVPVTLRFADAVGEILTARPEFQLPPLPFRHYI